MEKVRLFSILLAVLFVFSNLSSGEISFVGEGYIPEPNEEITLQIQTDTPLFAMGAAIYIVGDANITGGMCEADCNNFGWDNGWNSDPYIDDANGWVCLSGVRWASDANGIIGYIKFRYNSGCVNVYIDQEDSLAFSWDANGCHDVSFSTDSLVFGTCDANDSSQSENSLEENISAAEVNDVNLPFDGLWQNRQDGHQKKLIYYPADSIDRENILSKADYRAIAKNDLAMESAEKDSGEQSLMDSEPNIIEINSDITTNQLWTANNIYHITTDVDVQALLVIEPGTVIKFGANGTLWVNNGGTLISCGTPNNLITYTADADTSSYQYYYSPVYVESTASSATKITYSIVKYAYIGLMIDNKQLDSPIENNYLIHNRYGIVEYGTHLTDIVNNLIYDSYSYGINVSMESYAGIADANSHIRIENNTCDYYQDYGIVVFGADNIEDSPVVEVYNNIVSGSYEIGLGVVGYAYWMVSNTGYYDNIENTNADEYFPAYATSNPYVNGSGDTNLCHLVQTCPFINAGLEYIEQTQLIGKTTDVNGTPDSNFVDIGFHHPNWDFSNADGYYAGDLDENLIVDFRDFAILANSWQQTYDITDLFQMCGNWLMTGSLTPNLTLSFDKDPNNLGGNLTISANITSPNIYIAWLLMDGQIVAGLNSADEGANTAIIRTNCYRNGTHLFKVVCLYNDQIVLSSSATCVFNNELNSITQPKGFEPGKDYYLYAISDSNYSVELYNDVNETTAFTADSQNGINVQIPAYAFSDSYGIYDLNISKQESQSRGMQMLSSDPSWVDEWVQFYITRKFKMGDFQANSLYGIVVSIGSQDLEEAKAKCWKSVVKASVYRHIWPIVLRYDDCTWNNLKFCLNLTNVKMWYHLSHGAYDLAGQPQRSCINVNNEKVFSYLRKDFVTVPPNYQNLWWWYENNPSIAELGLQNSSKMIWAQFNCCYSARTTEFANQLGIWPIRDPLNIGNQIFIGWYDSARVYDMVEHYNDYEEKLWNSLKYGNSLQHAFNEAIYGLQGGLTIEENFRYYGVIDYQYAVFNWPDIN